MGEEKIEETKKDGKKFWNTVKEILGKSKEREEEAYVFTEEGERKNVIEISNEYMNEWKKKIYQKTNRIDLSFWYGKEDQIGKKEEMEEKEKQGDMEIMKIPVMTEDELVNIVRKMKNGKAAGIDGIRAELMKYIVRNDTIRKHILKCCNKVLEEKVQEDWLRSNTIMIPKKKKP